MKALVYIVVFTLVLINNVTSQNGDCSTSTITACNGNPTFPFTSYSGSNPWGNVQELPSGNSISNPSTNPASANSGCLFSGESSGGATWVQINISSSGTLGFQISQTGFSDWSMWPFNSTACADILNNILPPVRCNWNSSSTGGTGIGVVPAGGTAANFEPILNVTAGQSFIVCVTNYSNVFGTVNMNFTGTAGTSCVPYGLSTSQSICPGKTATLTASSNLGSPSYTWNPGGLNTQAVTVSPSTTTIYTVTIAGTNTVTSAFTTQVSTSTVTVFALPTLTLSSNSYVCPNSTFNLTASSGFTNYVWAGPTAYSQTTTIATTTIPNALLNMAGTYSVIGTTTQGCTVQATNTVGVVSTAPVIVTPTFSVCQGGNINLLANATGASSYSWVGPLSYTSAVQNPTLTNVLPSQTGAYTVTASFIVNTTTCTTKNTVTVSIIPSTTVALNPMPTVCNNGAITLTAPSGGNTYAWTGPLGFTSAVQNPTVSNASLANNGVYSLSVTTNGCVNTGTVNVSVYPPLNFVTTPTSISLCAGKTGVLGASGNGGSGVVNYQWNPTSGLSSPNTANTTVTGITTTEYTVTLSDPNCPITITPTVAVTVTVNPTPVISFTTSNPRGCESFTTDLISNSIPTSANCVWRFSNNLGYNSCNTPLFTFPIHSTYGATLTVTDINGCIDSVKNNAFIIVDPKPNADFDWNPSMPTILVNEIKFTDNSTIGLPITNWHWDFGDVFLTDEFDSSNVQNPTHVYDNVYTYTVNLQVTNSFGCKEAVTKLLILEDEFVLYIPNAFSPIKNEGKNDVFYVAGMGFLSDSFEMIIYDRWGSQVFKTNDVNKGWDGSIKGGPVGKEGIYIYKITVKDYKLREKEFVGHVTLL